MSVKKMLKMSLVVMGASLPLFAYALPPSLHVHNQTDQYSTTKINGGRCSSQIGEVTKPNEPDHVIPGYLISSACTGHISDCAAEVFMTNNCDGTPGAQSIATVHFNASTGALISNTPGPNRAYNLAASGLDFTLSKA